MSLVTKSSGSLINQGLVNDDALRLRAKAVELSQKMTSDSGAPTDTVESMKSSQDLPSKETPKSQNPARNSAVRKKVRQGPSIPEITKEVISKEALNRIDASAECKILLQNSDVNNVPEVFIESKEEGKLVPNSGRAIIRGLDTDRALIAAGQTPQSLSSWGRVYIYLPWEKRLEVLDELTSIDNHSPSMMLLGGVVNIADASKKFDSKRKTGIAAAARLDLVFRFGLLTCDKNVDLANRIKGLISQESRSSAYSFAMQDAVRFGDIEMVKHCLENNGRPLSPYDGKDDYREDSPIEIAFEKEDKAIQSLMIENLNSPHDITELKALFCDEDRWDPAPQEILDYILKF